MVHVDGVYLISNSRSHTHMGYNHIIGKLELNVSRCMVIVLPYLPVLFSVPCIHYDLKLVELCIRCSGFITAEGSWTDLKRIYRERIILLVELNVYLYGFEGKIFFSIMCSNHKHIY